MWPRMRKDIKAFMAAYDTCQRQNYEAIRPPGSLQPLPIPIDAWQDISLDFIEGLPTSQHKNVILIVVDRLTKYRHFIALSQPYTTVNVVDLFIQNIFRLHGMPRSIVNDHNPTFLSQFWNAFFKSQGSSLCRSSAYHP